MRKRLGCLSTSGLVAAAITVTLLVVLMVLGGGRLFSPGPLSERSGPVPRNGVTSHAGTAGNCSACHSVPWQRGTMSDRCTTCHVEVAEELEERTSFHGALLAADPDSTCQTCHTEHQGADAQLTAVDPERFPHQATGFSLQGHEQTTDGSAFLCSGCHGEDLTRFDTRVCDSCHREKDAAYMQAHVAAFGPVCLACHDGLDSYGAAFSHNRLGFSLVGQHALQSCDACHAGARSPTDLQETPSTCFDCHAIDDAHDGQLGTGCASCHTPEGWEGTTFDHSQTAFPLAGAHEGAACQACHSGGVFLATPTDCFDCHLDDDAHDGLLGPDCNRCHTPEGWEEATVNHALTGFPLTGKHQAVDCQECHQDLRFRGTPTVCAACHLENDAHNGALGQGCSTCHTPAGWEEATVDHSQTAFPLVGRHQQVQCQVCHQDQSYRGTPTLCYDCHSEDDVHSGALGQACSTCHTPAGWEAATVDHSQTAFPLVGRHEQVLCQECHQDQSYRGTPTLCYGCHSEDDAHQANLGETCEACHTPDGWDGATVDHAQTAFPLLGEHQQVGCRDCHDTLLFKGTPANCVACHEQDDAHEGRLGRACGQCHTPEGWAGATIDHALTAFPLLGRHQGVDCQSCHQDRRFSGTPTSCVACHEGDDAHGGNFGRLCDQCHTPRGWEEATFDHNQTGFPLTDLHRQVPCTQCHTSGVFQGTPKDCAACHDEPGYHAGLLGTDCSSCHSTTGWLPARYDRPHAFPYNHGANGPSSCRTCHSDSLDSYHCFSCHEPGDVTEEHDEEGITDIGNCARCHPTGEED